MAFGTMHHRGDLPPPYTEVPASEKSPSPAPLTRVLDSRQRRGRINRLHGGGTENELTAAETDDYSETDDTRARPRGRTCTRRRESGSDKPPAAVEPLEPLPLAFVLLLNSLRLFAAVPGTLGTIWLLYMGYEQIAREHRWYRTPETMSTPGGAEYLICAFWSASTAFHALSLMTLLLRRWLIYYALLPAVIRLVAFQCICWPLVRLWLYLFGPSQPIGAWVTISSFTAFNDVVARWVTSNITDADDEPEPELDERTDTSDGERHDTLSYGLVSQYAQDARVRRRQRYRQHGVRLVRVIFGGPTDDELSDADTDTDTDTDASFSPAPGRNTRLRVRNTRRDTVRPSAGRPWPPQQRPRGRLPGRRPHAGAASQFSLFQSYRAARIHSRRVFHWRVALWRNVVPIAVLGYLTLWVLIIGSMVAA